MDQAFDSRGLLFGEVFSQRLDTSHDQAFQYGLAEPPNPILTAPFRVEVRSIPPPAASDSNTVHVTVRRVDGHLVAEPAIATVYRDQNISWHYGEHESRRPFAIVAQDPVTPAPPIFQSDALGDGAVFAKHVPIPGVYRWSSIDAASGGAGPFAGVVTVRRPANEADFARLMAPPRHYVLRKSDVYVYENGKSIGKAASMDLLMGQPIVWALDAPDVEVGLVGFRDTAGGAVGQAMDEASRSSVRRTAALSRADLVAKLDFERPGLNADLLDPATTNDSLIGMLSYAVVDLKAKLTIASVRRDHGAGTCAGDAFHAAGAAVEVSMISGQPVAKVPDAVRTLAIALLGPAAADAVGVYFGGAIGDLIFDIPQSAISPGKVILQGGTADALHLHAKV